MTRAGDKLYHDPDPPPPLSVWWYLAFAVVVAFMVINVVRGIWE